MPHLVLNGEIVSRDFVIHNKYQVLSFFNAERSQTFMTTLRWEDLNEEDRKKDIIHDASCDDPDCHHWGALHEPAWSAVIEIWRQLPREDWHGAAETIWEFHDFTMAPDRVAPADVAIWKQIRGELSS